MPRLSFNPLPPDLTQVQRQNFIRVQIDAVGIGMANAAATFLPVFLTRLDASNFQVGLLSSMPAFTGFFFAVVVGRFLQSRSNVVPWFSLARLMVVSCYAATGLAGFIVPRPYLVPAVLAIWVFATLPQTMVNISFSVVMNAVAGPNHRYDLMSRRWSTLGLTSALTVALAGQMLEQIDFFLNYQLVFLAFSLGGLISYYYSSRIEIPDLQAPPLDVKGQSMLQRLDSYRKLVGSHPDFVRFSLQRFVFLTGTSLAIPLFPLYFVREVKANDAAIGLINTSATFVLVLGYFVWSRLSRKRGSRFVLVSTTLAMALYPALVATTQRVEVIVLLAGLAGIFQAGLDLVFFDELMKTVPVEYSATFISLAQSIQYISSMFSPLIGTLLADQIGLPGALVVSAVIRMSGFALFALWQGAPKRE